jgi:hypothetical protein
MMPFVFDNFFLEKWTALFRIAVALLRHMESDMMTMDLESASRYLREVDKLSDLSTQALLKSADSISLDKETINFVRDKFYVEQAEYKLR